MTNPYSDFGKARPQTPGPQNPGRYPFTGAAYRYWGEQPGYIYDPYRDSYRPDPKAQQDYYQREGLVKKPESNQIGLGALLGVGLAAPAIYEIGKGSGQGIVKGIGDMVSGTPADALKNTSGGLTAPTNTTPGALGAATPPTPAPAPIAPQGAPPAGAPGGMIAPQPQGVATGLTEGSTVLNDGTVRMADGTIVNPDAGTATSATGEPISAAQIGPYIQGALAALQIYNATRQFNDGDKLGAGLNAAGGIANLGAALGSTTAGSAVPFVNMALGAYNYKKLGDFLGDAPRGADTTKAAALQGFGAGGLVGAAIGTVGSFFGSGKGKEQMIRDKVRDYLQEKKIIGADYKGTLADGSTFDFGKDGKGLTKLDFSNPLDGKAAALADVIAASEGLTGDARKATAYLYAGAMRSNAKDEGGVMANYAHFAQQRGLTADAIQNELNRQYAAKQITQQQLGAFSNTLAQSTLGRPTVAVGAPPVQAPAAGAKAQPLAPGQTAQSTVAAASGGMIAPPPPQPGRSRTVSPGIGKDGRRISY